MSEPALSVLHVIPTLDPRVGGTASAAVAAVVSERRSGMAVTAVTTLARHDREAVAPGAARLGAEGARLLAFPTDGPDDRQAGLWGVSLPLAAWLLRGARRFDVIHAHGVWSLSTLVAGLAGRASGVPVVMTAHESLTRYDIDVASGSRPKRAAKLAMRRLLTPLVDLAVFTSELERRDSLWPRSRQAVVPHAVVDEASPPGGRRPGGEVFTIGYLGRLHPKKGLESLLEALADPSLDGARLAVCGDGEPGYRRSLERRAAELGLAERVEWRGHVGREGRDRLFSEVQVLAMPSAYECFGMVAAEAMAMGVPVVVSETTGVAPVVERHGCGLVVGPGDPSSLAGALAELAGAEPGRLEEMGRRAGLASREEFTFAARGAAMRRLYAGLAGNGSVHV